MSCINCYFFLALYFKKRRLSGEAKTSMLNKVILCLGSNRDKENNIELADQLLRDHFVSIRFSEAVYTEPMNMRNPSFFLNQVAVAFTTEKPDEIIDAFKQIERLLGRVATDKLEENIRIDIDLLQWNDCILKPLDLQRPYVQSALRVLGAGQEDERSDQEAGLA